MSKKISSAVAVLALFAAAGASAGDRHYGSHQYRADPQVRVGIDILWGGTGHAHHAPRPVAVHPVHHVPRHAHHHDAGHGGYAKGHGKGHGHGNGLGHRKHRH